MYALKKSLVTYSGKTSFVSVDGDVPNDGRRL